MNDSIEFEQTRTVGTMSVKVRVRYETTGRIDVTSRARELASIVMAAASIPERDPTEPCTATHEEPTP